MKNVQRYIMYGEPELLEDSYLSYMRELYQTSGRHLPFITWKRKLQVVLSNNK